MCRPSKARGARRRRCVHPRGRRRGADRDLTLLTPLPEHLAVGETAVIGVRVKSSEPFLMAIALSDAY